MLFLCLILVSFGARQAPTLKFFLHYLASKAKVQWRSRLQDLSNTGFLVIRSRHCINISFLCGYTSERHQLSALCVTKQPFLVCKSTLSKWHKFKRSTTLHIIGKGVVLAGKQFILEENNIFGVLECQHFLKNSSSNKNFQDPKIFKIFKVLPRLKFIQDWI